MTLNARPARLKAVAATVASHGIAIALLFSGDLALSAAMPHRFDDDVFYLGVAVIELATYGALLLLYPLVVVVASGILSSSYRLPLWAHAILALLPAVLVATAFVAFAHPSYSWPALSDVGWLEVGIGVYIVLSTVAASGGYSIVSRIRRTPAA